MSCPEYYKLADGRELADFLKNEISGLCWGHIGHYSSHCLMSAMEHRYRRGKKEGEFETDIAAEQWWTQQAIESHHDARKINEIVLKAKTLIDHQINLYEIKKR